MQALPLIIPLEDIYITANFEETQIARIRVGQTVWDVRSSSTSQSRVIPVLLSYLLSFIYLGIYWNNHHHMMHTCKRATGSMLWPNLYLIFWLSLVPFATGWMNESHFASVPVAAYGIILLMAAIAYWVLQQRIIASQGESSVLKRAIGIDWKGNLSPILYAAAIVLSFVLPWISIAIYVSVALIWVVPDRRVERAVVSQE